jgi:hypothetical protein
MVEWMNMCQELSQRSLMENKGAQIARLLGKTFTTTWENIHYLGHILPFFPSFLLSTFLSTLPFYALKQVGPSVQ